MTYLTNFYNFIEVIFGSIFSMLSTNTRYSIFPFLTGAIITTLFVRVLFKRGKSNS